MPAPTEYIIEPTGRKVLNWREVWQYKELFYFFTWRDLKVKYKQTVLGLLWVLLQPLLMMIIFTFFFGRALNVPSQNLPYPIFVFSGLLIWNIFSMGITNAANSMVSNAPIIKKIYFPRIVIPVSALISALFDFLVAFVLLVVLLLYFNQPVRAQAFWCWPAALVAATIATLGPGCLLAALNVKYRDFRYLIPFMVQILLFLTPVIYPDSLITNPLLHHLLTLSPVYAAIELFRYPLTGVWPDPLSLILSLGSGVVLLFVGLIYFRRTEDFFADLS